MTNEAQFVTAGFEVNHLNIRTLQSQFVSQNGISNEDLAFSFANRLMYPLYTILIVPGDPEKRDAWINTLGDPVHFILPVSKNYSGNRVFMQNGPVNPELVKLYNQASIFAQLIPLLDFQFYKELSAAFGNASKIRKPLFLVGDYINGWTYGTLFNASPLCYELYLQNYLHFKGKQFNLYMKYGRPFKNLGFGISMNDITNYKKVKSDILLEAWDQDLFGNGISVELKGEWKINQTFGLMYNIGYKTKGYMLGKQLDPGLILGTGICIYN